MSNSGIVQTVILPVEEEKSLILYTESVTWPVRGSLSFSQLQVEDIVFNMNVALQYEVREYTVFVS